MGHSAPFPGHNLVATAAWPRWPRSRWPDSLAVGSDGRLYIGASNDAASAGWAPTGSSGPWRAPAHKGLTRRRRPRHIGPAVVPQRPGGGAGWQLLHLGFRRSPPHPPGGPGRHHHHRGRRPRRRLQWRRDARHSGPAQQPLWRGRGAGRQPVHRRPQQQPRPPGGPGAGRVLRQRFPDPRRGRHRGLPLCAERPPPPDAGRPHRRRPLPVRLRQRGPPRLRSPTATATSPPSSATPAACPPPSSVPTASARPCRSTATAISPASPVPAARRLQLESAPDGLLASLTDPRDGLHEYTYDEDGRLIQDDEPGDGFKTLSRVDGSTRLHRHRVHGAGPPDHLPGRAAAGGRGAPHHDGPRRGQDRGGLRGRRQPECHLPGRHAGHPQDWPRPALGDGGAHRDLAGHHHARRPASPRAPCRAWPACRTSSTPSTRSHCWIPSTRRGASSPAGMSATRAPSPTPAPPAGCRWRPWTPRAA